MTITQIKPRYEYADEELRDLRPAPANIREIMRDPWHPDRPTEWEPVPERFKPMLYTTRGYFTPEQMRLWEAIMKSQWYLLANSFYDRNGERLRAKRYDNRKHNYITVKGIPAPYHSLNELIGKMTELDGEYVEDATDRSFSVMNIDAMMASRIEVLTRTQAHRLIKAIRARGADIYPEIRI